MARVNYGLCNDCKLKKDFLVCADCCVCICLDCLNKYNHDLCKKCKKNATCNMHKKCYDCQIGHYNMITKSVAVGDCESSYDEFDIIVNLFGEFNGSYLDEIVFVEENNKKIYNVGLIDKSKYKDNALALIKYLIPELMTYSNKKILFHCYAGVSRSATFAIAYLMKKHKLTKDEAFNLVKTKRPAIYPNYGFLKILDEL
jgi:protein tyrosine phosphatase